MWRFMDLYVSAYPIPASAPFMQQKKQIFSYLKNIP